MKGSEFVLVGAVVIHDPEFLGAGVAVNESDLRGGDARNTAGEFGDDFVGELGSEFAHLCVGGITAIDLAHDGFGGGAANIEHPSEDGNFGGSFGEIPEGQEIRVDGILSPVEHAEFPGLGRSVGRIEAGTGEVDNAGEGQVVADTVSEKAGVGFGGVGPRGEIGYGDTGLLNSETGAGAKPVLREGGGGEREEDEEAKEKRGEECRDREGMGGAGFRGQDYLLGSKG